MLKYKKITLLFVLILFISSNVLFAQAKTEPLPPYVPAEGSVAILTVENGGLANNFRDGLSSYFNPWYGVKIRNDYSGAIANPNLGKFGAVHYFGGGHRSCNDNTLISAVPGEKNISFVRQSNPTPYFGTGTDAKTCGENSIANTNSQLDPTTGANTAGGVHRPPAIHSYQVPVTTPEGFELVVLPAMNYQNDGGVVSAWQLPIINTKDVFEWQRIGKQAILTSTPHEINWQGTPIGASQWAAPIFCVFAPSQNRVYIECNSFHAPKWFDRTTKTYVQGTGAQRPRAPVGYDGGSLIHIPSRSLNVFLEATTGSNLRLHWMDVSKDQPGWNQTAVTLSTPLTVTPSWSTATWIPELNRIIVVGVKDDIKAYYEIEVPTKLDDAWVVTRRPWATGTLATAPQSGVDIWRDGGAWAWLPKIKSFVYLREALRTDQGNDQVYI
jgi:hypothetical protein